jgi:hypothetical protein
MMDVCATLGLSALPRLSPDMAHMLREVTSTNAELDAAIRYKGVATTSEASNVVAAPQTSSLTGHKRTRSQSAAGLEKAEDDTQGDGDE